MPETKRQILMQAFSQMKQRFVFKWETEEMEGKPDNVLLRKWCPQQDILGHENVKAFITHGGLLSSQESVYHNTPMLYIPWSNDQFIHALNAMEKGYGRKITWSDISPELLRYSS